MKHWANQYIGKKWERGAEGPDAFDCWSFVRHVFKEQYGKNIPTMEIPCKNPEQYSYQWKPIEKPVDGCGVLMRNEKSPHVGVWLDVNGGIVLHCTKGRGVTIDDAQTLKALGAGKLHFYECVA